MKTVAIVQARMGSTRLPGKVMMDLGGQTVLQWVVERLRRSKLVEEIVVATTTCPADIAIVKECDRLGVASFRGSEADVLDRYFHAAAEINASQVVRVTSDCPLIDPEIVDETIRVFQESNADYANNTTPRTFPRGLDVEVMKMSALRRTWLDAQEPYQREHVTPYIYEHPELFQLASYTGTSDYSRYRWTLDTPEDLQLLTKLCSRLSNRNDFGWKEAVAVMGKDSQLAEINSQVMQKTFHS